MQRLGSRQSKDEKQGQEQSNTVKQSAKKEGQSNDDAGPDIPMQHFFNTGKSINIKIRFRYSAMRLCVLQKFRQAQRIIKAFVI